jgi:hypothetical protein
MTDVVSGSRRGVDRSRRGADQGAAGPESAVWRRPASDIAILVLLAALVVIVLCTYRDFAVSNDEGVQHRYGEMILAYYRSGFVDRSLFGFQNLYLYGGLFDIVVVALSHLIPIDPYDLRHIVCAITGVGGIAAAAAIARLIAGPSAGLIAAIALTLCGVWSGAMFNHTKDIPFAAAMTAAMVFLLRGARDLPRPRAIDLAGFGVFAGAALGIRVLGLLLVAYAAMAILLSVPRPWIGHGGERLRFVGRAVLSFVPPLLLAYLIMILAWPWAALSPLNPLRGLLAFSEFQYSIRTLLAGQVYDMAHVPRLYVPIYILVRLPMLTLLGAALGLLLALRPGRDVRARREIGLVAMAVLVPLLCQAAFHGPAFTGLRHFLFVIPLLAVLAGIGLDAALRAAAARGRGGALAVVAVIGASFLWTAVTLVRLHPYEGLFYNSLVGGLQGASRRYDTDYWFNSMPEALALLESHLRHDEGFGATSPPEIYSVAVCGERLAFDKNVTLPQLRWDFMSTWEQSQFFLAPTQMNCDADLDGEVIGKVERLGVVIATIKDRRRLARPATTAAR